MTKFLWLAPRWPFPANDGAKRATLELLRPLIRQGVEIDFLGFPAGWEDSSVTLDSDSKVILGGLRHASRTERGFKRPGVQKALGLFQSLLGQKGLPYSVQAFRASAVCDVLRKKLAENDWDAVVIDGLHVAAAWFEVQGKANAGPKEKRPLIYRAHNVESKIWEMAAEKTGLGLRNLARGQASRMKAFESRVLATVSCVAPVSLEDEAKLRALEGSIRSKVIPIGSDFSVSPSPLSETEPLKILFVGKLDWPPNREGLEWFLDRVWAPLRHSAGGNRYEFHVVGGGASSELSKKLVDLRAVHHGRQPNLDSFYAEAQLAVSPIFVGSGTRVKILESVQKGRPVLSTHLGAEGLALDSESAYLCDSEEEWLQVIQGFRFEEAKVKSNRAFSIFRERYDSGAMADLFLQLVDEARQP